MDLSQLKRESKGYLKTPKTSEQPKQVVVENNNSNQTLEKNKTFRITFAVTPAEKEKIYNYCDETGMSLSKCIRRALKNKELI